MGGSGWVVEGVWMYWWIREVVGVWRGGGPFGGLYGIGLVGWVLLRGEW